MQEKDEIHERETLDLHEQVTHYKGESEAREEMSNELEGDVKNMEAEKDSLLLSNVVSDMQVYLEVCEKMKTNSEIQNFKVKHETMREMLEDMIARNENDNEKMR